MNFFSWGEKNLRGHIIVKIVFLGIVWSGEKEMGHSPMKREKRNLLRGGRIKRGYISLFYFVDILSYYNEFLY